MSIDLHCMINRLASRGCCLLPGPGKGRYQRRLSLPRVNIHIRCPGEKEAL